MRQEFNKVTSSIVHITFVWWFPSYNNCMREMEQYMLDVYLCVFRLFLTPHRYIYY